MWAQGGRQERSKSLLVAAWGAQKFIGWAPAPPRGDKLVYFRVPERSPEALGRAPGRYFGLFDHAALGSKHNKKQEPSQVFLLFERLF